MYYKHFENITLDDIHHPKIAATAHIVYCTLTPINTILIAVFSCIILKKSPPAMNIYKHVLVVKLLSCYFYNVAVFLWQPIPLYPLRALYCVGFICDGPVINVIMIVLTLAAAVMIVSTALFQLLFQCVNTSLIDNDLLRRLFLNPRLIYASFFMLFLSSIGFIFAFFILSVHDNTDLAFIADIPALRTFVNETPSFNGLHPDFDGSVMTVFIGIALSFIVITMTGATILFIAFVRHMGKIKTTITPSTYEGFLMMFRAIVAQLILFLFYCVILNGLSNFQLAFGFLWSSYTTPLMVSFCVTNISCECLVLLYFIKPYRIFFIQLFRKAVVDIKISKSVTLSNAGH